MKILHAEDHPIFCQGIRPVLQTLADEVMVFEAHTIAHALEILKTNRDMDLILLDLAMPGMENFAGFYAIKKLNPDIPIVVLSVSEDTKHVRLMMKEGVRGYIPKSVEGEVIKSALKLVLAGGRYLPELLLEQLTTTETKKGKLSKRQREILTLIAQGLSNKAIAARLGISENTVKMHVKMVLQSLCVKTRTEAVVKAQRLGEISTTD
jgi:DNA-binding NarL/FixJ family response regulator